MDGWRCPVCGKGVSPDTKTCDHDGVNGHEPSMLEKYREIVPHFPYTPPSVPAAPWPDRLIGGCTACRNGGVCMCTIWSIPVTCGTVTCGNDLNLPQTTWEADA